MQIEHMSKLVEHAKKLPELENVSRPLIENFRPKRACSLLFRICYSLKDIKLTHGNHKNLNNVQSPYRSTKYVIDLNNVKLTFDDGFGELVR